jgi:RNA polymerase sigma-70 factor, ECF subfamily
MAADTGPGPAPAHPPDADLVGRAAAGDASAFRELVVRHQVRVYQIVYRMLRDRTDADDVTQETFVRVFRNLDRFDRTREFGPWLHTIARNAALNYIASRGRRRAASLDELSDKGAPPPASRDESPLESIARREIVERVRGAMDALPEEQRLVLTLREFDGLQYDEIAATLGIPIGTVMSRLSRARAALATRLRARGIQDAEAGNPGASDRGRGLR